MPPPLDQTAEFKALKSQRSNLIGTRPNNQSNDRSNKQPNQRPFQKSGNQTNTYHSNASNPPNTRVIVRGLPVSFTEQKLRDHIETKLAAINQSKQSTSEPVKLTDVRLMKTAEGRSRQFAFVGFKHLDQAVNFQKLFNQTFIQSSKITVDYAYERGSELIERPWSKYSENSRLKDEKDSPVVGLTVHKKKDEQSKQSIDQPISQPSKRRGLASLVQSMLPSDKASSLLADRTFLDYLHAMGGNGKSKFWANDESDETINQSISQSMDKSELSASEKSAVMELLKQQTGDSDDEDDDAFDNPSIDLLNASSEQSINQSNDQMEDDDEEDNEDDDEDEQKEESKPEVDPSSNNQSTETTDVPDVSSLTESSLDPCRLFVKNLPYELTDEEFEGIFKPLIDESSNQSITQLHVSRSSDGRCRGYGFVSFDSAGTAQSIKQTIDGKIVLGRILRLDVGQARPDSGAPANESFKQKRDRELKSKALTNVNVWNSLFLRPDTVMAAMAAKLGVSKAELLSTGKESSKDDVSNSLAVRMALAETSMIDDTKAWLVEEGIDVDILEQKALELSQVGMKQPNNKAKPAAPALARSDRVLLVKHTPFESDISELRRMFAAHGSLVRFVMPPSHSMAIAEFADAFSAKKAFAAIAYTKYKHVPLFLEWAPKAAIKERPAAAIKKSLQAEQQTADKLDARSLAGIDADEQASGTIFVKNLNFTTDDATLRTFIESIAAVRSVTITKKKNSKANIEKGEPATLSMGYGFVELTKASDVARVIGQLSGKELQGHVVQMQPSTRAVAKKPAASAKREAAEMEDDDAGAMSSRVIVKNMPFEATLEEIEALFSSRTSVKRVRLPKKIDGRHRGFAFIDFSSRNEAKKAILELSNTHLYGRKLVMQFSKEGEDGADENEEDNEGGEEETQQRKKKRRRTAH